MTSISGVSSSSGSSVSSASQLPAAQSAITTLLTSSGMLENLDTAGPSGKAPTSQQVLSALQALINPNNSNTVTKADVTQAVTSLGGSASDATAIWSQLSPYGLNNISKTSVESNQFLASGVNSNISAIQTSLSKYASSPAGIAGNTMTQLLTSNDVVSALSSESSTYVPPTTNQMVSTLFALFDVNGSKTISESGVKTAVLQEGGTANDAKDLWSQLSPTGAPSISAAQLVNSAFVNSALTANTQVVQSDVAKYQLANTGTSNSVLDMFSSSGADVLGGAASGYNDSPVGNGGASTDLDLFT